MGSSVCSLIALELKHSGLVGGDLNLTDLVPLATDQALVGNNWMLAYEGGRRRWLANENLDFIQGDACFAALLEAGVSFYSEAAQLPPIFQLKQSAPISISTPTMTSKTTLTSMTWMKSILTQPTEVPSRHII